MSDGASDLPKTNTDSLKLLVANDPLAKKLVEAAATGSRQEALAATKAVLIAQVQETLTKLRNGKT